MNAITDLHSVLTKLQSHWLPPAANGPAASARSDMTWPAGLFADAATGARPVRRATTDWAAAWTGIAGSAEPAIEAGRSPDLSAVSHIFFRADQDDARAMAAATARAETALQLVTRRPERFEEIARAVSECPSAAAGGRLGRVLDGDVTAEFARVMRALQPGQLCPVAVRTQYGIHIVRLDERIAGRLLPTDPAQDGVTGRAGRAA